MLVLFDISAAGQRPNLSSSRYIAASLSDKPSFLRFSSRSIEKVCMERYKMWWVNPPQIKIKRGGSSYIGDANEHRTKNSRAGCSRSCGCGYIYCGFSAWRTKAY